MVLATTTPCEFLPIEKCRGQVRSAIQCCSSLQSEIHTATDERRADERHASNLPIRIYPALYDSVTNSCQVEYYDADVGLTRDLTIRGVGWQQAVDFECDHVALEIEAPGMTESVWVLVEIRWSNRGMFGVESGGLIKGMLQPPE